MPLPAYAQNAEDVMLWRLFKDQATGFYVDVGAQDPEVDSVTKRFYDHGWTGINIEPVPAYFQALRTERPRDINLDVLVGAIDGELTFHHVEGTGLSTTRADLAELHARDGRTIRVETLPIFRLQTLFDQHGITTVDFLKVDTEGSEADVLMGLDFGKVRPKVLVIESTLPNSREESHDQWEPRLIENGYHLAYRDGLNRFYLDTPYLDWRIHFELPPNVFDDYLPAKIYREKQASEAAQTHLHKTIEQLNNIINSNNKEKENLVSIIQIKNDEIDNLIAQIAHKVEQTGRYHRLIIDSLNENISEKENELKNLHSHISTIQNDLNHVRSVHERSVRTLSWKLTTPLRIPTQFAGRVVASLGPMIATRLANVRSATTRSGHPSVDSLPEGGRWLFRRLTSRG